LSLPLLPSYPGLSLLADPTCRRFVERLSQAIRRYDNRYGTRERNVVQVLTGFCVQ